MLDGIEADATQEIDTIERQKQQLLKELMIKDRDIFAPCLKLKNKIQLQPDASAIALLRRSEQNITTEEKLKEIIHSKLREEMNLRELPNFTSQVDFGLNRTAQRIYKENSKMLQERRKKKFPPPNSYVIEETKAL